MYNQIEAILSQYEMEIHEVTKGRGAYICDTDKGSKLLVAFRGSKEKGEFLKRFLAALNEIGFFAEQIEENKEGEAVTRDEMTGEHFIIKDHIFGTEINTARADEVKSAVILLAQYHNASREVRVSIPDKMRENSNSVVETRRRHYREINKVKNYIRGRKKKNQFEQLFMSAYESMITTAEASLEILERQKEENLECLICHGDYNQHNVVWSEGAWRMIHFENFTYSWAMLDLANFLRKMMEKNEWNIKYGLEWIEAYHNVHPLNQNEIQQLYGLLLFPEKFWKVTNHYMSSRKTWISEKDIEKLQKVIEQETLRLLFAENLFSISR